MCIAVPVTTIEGYWLAVIGYSNADYTLTPILIGRVLPGMAEQPGHPCTVASQIMGFAVCRISPNRQGSASAFIQINLLGPILASKICELLEELTHFCDEPGFFRFPLFAPIG